MKISEAHDKLNRRCVIAIRQKSGIFDVMSRVDDRVPAYVFSENEETYLQLFFHKNDRKSPALSPVLSRKDLIEKRSYYSISERINNIDGMKSITKLMETPSVALNEIYMLRNELFMDFRFHSNKLHEINDILSEVIGNNQNFRIVKMTFSRSLSERMQEIHSRTPLAVVRYSVPVPTDSEVYRYMEKNHPDAVAEIEGRSITEKGIKVLFYTSEPIRMNGIEPISAEDLVYEAYISEKSLLEGRRRGNDARIPRIAFFLTMENGRLIDTTFVPAAEADEYVGIMMNALMVDHESHPLLEYYSELDEGVWEWI